MGDFQEALREVEPSAVREVFVEVPNVRWGDVGGLEEIKQRLQEAVQWPLAYPELFQSARLAPPKGALLCGPPGCGKTLVAKALATEAGVNFVSVKGPELLSMYVGNRSADSATSSARRGRRPPASSSSTRSTPWRRRAPAARKTPASRAACSASSLPSWTASRN
jgi:AAA+ superfamily predicted ATPase